MNSLKLEPLLPAKERDRVMEAWLQAGLLRFTLTGKVFKLVNSSASLSSSPKQNCSCTTTSINIGKKWMIMSHN